MNILKIIPILLLPFISMAENLVIAKEYKSEKTKKNTFVDKKVLINIFYVGCSTQVTAEANVASPEFFRITANTPPSQHELSQFYNPDIGVPLSFSSSAFPCSSGGFNNYKVKVVGYNFSKVIYTGNSSFQRTGIVPINPNGNYGDVETISIVITKLCK